MERQHEGGCPDRCDLRRAVIDIASRVALRLLLLSALPAMPRAVAGNAQGDWSVNQFDAEDFALPTRGAAGFDPHEQASE